MPKAFGHVIAAIATPFRPRDLSVDFDILTAHAHWLLDNGCDGLVLFGTTGEAPSLTAAERKTILERLIQSGVCAGALLVGTSACAIDDTVDLTLHAAGLQCAGALLMPPFFFKGVSVDGARQYYDAVIRGCGGKLPSIYLYHIPQASGVAVGVDLVEQLIERHGASIRGYKDSSGQWANTREILARFPQLEVFVGSETLLLDNLRAGGAGCISAGVNVQPAAARRVYERSTAADAEKLQAEAAAVRKALERAGPIIASTKAILAELHQEPAWAVPRPPLEALGADARAKLCAELRTLHVAGL